VKLVRLRLLWFRSSVEDHGISAALDFLAMAARMSATVGPDPRTHSLFF